MICSLYTPLYYYAYGVTTGVANRAMHGISGNCRLFTFFYFCLITSLFTIEASELIMCSALIQQMINFTLLTFSQVQIPKCLHLGILCYISAAHSALCWDERTQMQLIETSAGVHAVLNYYYLHAVILFGSMHV